jgi:hypothetical protein
MIEETGGLIRVKVLGKELGKEFLESREKQDIFKISIGSDDGTETDWI